MVLVLLAVLPFLLHGIRRGEFLLNHDEEVHAITGLYFADLLRDLPVTHLHTYTNVWYAHYPNLGVLVWPPLFHLEEALFFLLFGPTAVTARLAALAFVLFGLAFWFRLVNEIAGPYAAAAATFVLAVLPHLLLFEQSAMLEIPLLALATAAIFYWLRYLRTGVTRPLLLFAFFAALTVLTKQNCVFIPVYCLLTLAFEKKLRWIATKAMLAAVAIVVVIAGPYLIVSTKLVHSFLGTDLARGMSFTSLAAYVRYLRILPAQITWPVLILSLVGLASWRWWCPAPRLSMEREGRAGALGVPSPAEREAGGVAQPHPAPRLSIEARRIALWIAAVYLTFLAIPHKESRYVLYWAPAFVFFAVVPLCALHRSTARPVNAPRWAARAAAPVLAALLLTCAVMGWRFARPSISGYRAVANAVVHLPRPAHAPAFVAFDGRYFGNFIFYTRALDPGRHWIVLRKLLYVTDVERAWGLRELVHSPAQVRQKLAAYGIRYILVDNRPDLLPSERYLRAVLHQPPYRLIETFPIHANTPENQGIVVSLYENPGASPPTARNLVLPMMTLDHSIIIPMNRLALP